MFDCHAHLNDDRMNFFLESYVGDALPRLRIISNSVDIESSKKNLELAKRFQKSIICFVGIHPEIMGREDLRLDEESIDKINREMKSLCPLASGIGEIGLDEKYGRMDLQRHLLRGQLEIAESFEKLPVCIHSRGSLSEILEKVSTYDLHNTVLFHWFSGTEKELRDVNDKGYYVSFGLPVLYSKRISRLIAVAERSLLLAETDSPIIMESISQAPISPFGIGSVVFGMSCILGVKFEEMVKINERNAQLFLKRKPH